MKILVVGDKKTNIGFMLAGVCENLDEDIEYSKLKSKLKDPNLSLALFTNSSYQKHKELIDRFEMRKTKVTPILMQLPKYDKLESDEIDQLVRKALGVKIGD